MLQIISGKFFESNKDINKQLEYEILYSNFFSYIPIETEIFELIPINSHQEKINKFLIKYENKYQPRDDKDVLYLATSESIIFHIQYILTFYFNAYFHKNKANVEQLCSITKNPHESKNIANVHLPHIFNLKKEDKKLVDGFSEFMNSIILLERKSYNLLMKLLKAYYNAIESFETSYEFSYMTLVYTLETLISDINEYKPTWVDYDEAKRFQLEKVFHGIEHDKVNKIKAILLKDSNLKLKKQFVNNLYQLTGNDFFEPNNSIIGKKILKSELNHVLNNLYLVRSKYVHKLDSLDKVIQTHGFSKTDYIYDKNDPKFSIYGLVIYTKYIINKFLQGCKLLECEDYLWRSELPGIITVNLAPQYWVWKHEGLKPEHLNMKLCGFLELLSLENKILEIKELILKIERMFEQLSEQYFISAFSLYLLYNLIVDEESKSPNSKAIIDRYLGKTQQCSIQYMVIGLYVKELPCWPLEEQEIAIEKYFKNKFKKQSIQLNNILEVMLLSRLANQYLFIKEDKYIEFIERAILESTNNINTYNYLQKCKNEKKEIDLAQILS